MNNELQVTEIKQAPNADLLCKYTPAIQAAILRAYGISECLDGKLNRDQHGRFELYFYPESDIHKDFFVKEGVNYWRAKKGRIQDRRLVIILQPSAESERCIAVVLQLNANQLAAAAAWESRSQVAEQKLYSEVTQWYNNPEVTLLGAHSQDPSVSTILSNLRKALKTAYTIAGNIKCEDIPASPDSNIILVHQILNMLIRGETQKQTQPITAAVAARAHYNCCIKALMNRISKYLLEDVEGRKKICVRIVENLNCLYKHSLIIAHRKKTNTANTADLIASDQQFKRVAYSQPVVDLKDILPAFSLQDLLEFLSFAQPTAWLSALEAKQASYQAAIKTWERQIQSKLLRDARGNPCEYITGKMITLFKMVYHSSWAGIAQEIFAAFSKITFQEQTTSSLAVVDMTRPAVISAKKWVQTITRSPTLAKRSGEWVAGLWVERPLSDWIGVYGIGIGLILQYYLGFFNFMRTVIMVASAHAANQWLESREIHDKTAEIVSTLSGQTVMRIICMVSSLIEGYSMGTFYPVWLTGFALSGSAALTTGSQIIVSRLGSRSTQYQEEKQKLIFLLAFAGSEAGRFLFHKIYPVYCSVQERLAAREQAVRFATFDAGQKNLRNFRAELPSFLSNYTLLFGDDNPVRFAWTDFAGHEQVLDCQITHIPILNMNCTHSESSPISLPSPGV